ncbi:helix-turn-helix domain-containing protein [Haloarchaeobius sp. HRN-SO-5]|uniref:helix-turn-helix domain-containing protein n=1 Tax=Haloarchaeobius sp. HRN-SO-5 TaxID=3446118 RepID=UPI003EBA2946
MTDPMSDILRQDMQCEGLLQCFHGVKELDLEVFQFLTAQDDPMTVDEIADAIERERSTAYRSIQRLVQAGFVQNEQVNYDQGGYYHVYRPADPDEVTDDMQRMLNDWYAKMGQLIDEFREKYEHAADQTAAAED